MKIGEKYLSMPGTADECIEIHKLFNMHYVVGESGNTLISNAKRLVALNNEVRDQINCKKEIYIENIGTFINNKRL